MRIEVTQDIQPSRFAELKNKNETAFFETTRFNFLKKHHGLRPGKLHILLGTTGTGKTSLTRTIIADLCVKHRVCVYSTEETREEFETQLAYTKTELNTENLRYFHEDYVLDVVKKIENIEGFINQIDWALADSRAEILIFDNITASVFYQDIKHSGVLAQKLFALMKKTNIPFFLVAHTNSTVKENVMFEASDMRGSRLLSMKAEYLYCLARFHTSSQISSGPATYLKVDKSRTHDGGKQLYRLWYDCETKQYICDEKETYEKFKEVTSRR